MHPFFRTVKQSLSTQLIVTIVAFILVTSIATGIPAYWLVSTELERQAWERVQDGKRVTLSLLEAEKERINDLVTLTSQRPTLKKLLRDKEVDALSKYLNTYQSGVEIDILFVQTLSNQFLAGNGSSFDREALKSRERVSYYVTHGSDNQLVLLASHPVVEENGGELLGYVVAGSFLDEKFLRILADKTGIEQSIVINGFRTATSLGKPLSEVDANTYAQIISSGQSATLTTTFQGNVYYTALFPIPGAHEKIAALVEVALPVDGLITTERRSLLTLFASTMLVAAIGSALGGFYARRITSPLDKLTTAAQNISQGHLSTPIPIPEEPHEITTLAAALEESRINTRRALDDLTKTKARLETLVQSITEGIVTFDDQEKITSFSQGAEKITGWSENEAMHKRLDKVFQMGDGEGKFIEHIHSNSGLHQFNVLTHSGQEITLSVTNTRFKTNNSSAVEEILVLRDITKEKAAQRLHSYFLANISHEFRTPLAALNASVELLLDEIQNLSLAENIELLNSIHYSLTSLQTLIDNLLESTSIEAGHFRIRRRPTEVSDVVEEAILTMQPLLDRRQQSISVYAQADIPMLNVDPTRLTQVMVNLISNASKYGPMQETIELHLEKINNSLLRVAIADRGSGISPTERKNLFHRFVRLDDQNEAQYGIGLGLSVVKTIVEEHGGEVGVDERPEGGSIFWFILYLDEDTA
jgi:PAS domain S-box-containing protein